MKLEPKPALKATLYLVLFGGLVALEIILPAWVVATTLLPLSIGVLWYLLYAFFKDRDRLQKR
jgi:hypothetical protein